MTVLEQDGYAVLKGQLPPTERRGLVLIDPPYESEAEFDAVLAALMHGHERWPTGMYCVWYPQTERAGSLRFHRELRESGIRRILDAQLSVLPPDSAVGMQGCGLAIVNPPWQLDLRLTQLLPELHALLAPDGAGGTRGRVARAGVAPRTNRGRRSARYRIVAAAGQRRRAVSL